MSSGYLATIARVWLTAPAFFYEFISEITVSSGVLPRAGEFIMTALVLVDNALRIFQQVQGTANHSLKIIHVKSYTLIKTL